MTTPLDKAVEAMALDRAVEAVTDALDGEQLKWLASSPPNRKALAAAALQAADDLLREHYWGELRERLGKLERFDPEHEERSPHRAFLLGNDPIVMEAYSDGDWLRRSDVLATTQKEEL